MLERDLVIGLSILLLVLALPTVIYLLFWTAPYGRFSSGRQRFSLPNRLGWIVMESPAVLLFSAIYGWGAHRAESVPLLFLALWLLHYVHRTFVFPFRTRTSGKRMPWLIIGSALAFNSLNAYVNARWISHFGEYPTSWLSDPRFVSGVGLFVVGMGINLHADTVLLNLRKPGETGYKIPRGGLYRWVTCPNYLGELLEWTGWAIATWSLPGLGFAVYTAANLVPRALTNHRWYHERFEDYPKQRRALIPFVL